jgi:GAF domain-containing protein
MLASESVTEVVEQLQRLQELVARATEPTTIDGVARVLVDEGVAVLRAAMGGLWLREGDELRLVQYNGMPPDQFARIPLASDAPLAACVRDGEPVWLRDADEYRARFPVSFTRVVAQIGCACLPLIAGGNVIGGAVFEFEQRRELSAPERVSMMMLARQCAQAIDRIRLVAATQQLAGRMSALQRIAGRFAAARGFDEIARIVIEEGVGALGASATSLWRVEGREAVLVAQIGAPRSVVEVISRISLDSAGALPAALATRTAQYLESRQAAAARQQLVEERWADIEATAFVPPVADDRLHGALGLGFAEPRQFDASEREMIELFAGHAAQAIARDRDDAAQRVLAEASSQIASTLDAETVLQRVGLVRPDGSLERAVVSHADPPDRELAERIRKLGGPATHGVASVFESQQPLLLEHISHDDLARLVRNETPSDAIRAVRARSVVCVPMSVGGRAIGALTWLTRGRGLDAHDLRLAGQVARGRRGARERAAIRGAGGGRSPRRQAVRAGRRAVVGAHAGRRR